MNKGVIGFLLGGAIGGVTAWFFTKKHCEKAAEAEIDDIRAKYRDELRKMREENKEKEAENESKQTENEPKTPSEETKNSFTGKTYNDYRKLASTYLKYSQDEFDCPAEESGAEKIRIEDVDDPSELPDDMPKIITQEMFLNDPTYEKETIGYYEDEEIFVDTDDNVLPQLHPYDIGMDNLKHFSDDGRLYVRSSNLETDFEILLENGNFYKISVGD